MVHQIEQGRFVQVGRSYILQILKGVALGLTAMEVAKNWIQNLPFAHDLAAKAEWKSLLTLEAVEQGLAAERKWSSTAERQ